MKIFDTLDLISPPLGTVLGNHGIWLPSLGVKVPFQFGGRVTKRTRQEASYPRESIADEVHMLRALAAQGMAPPVGEMVFFRHVASDYPGAWHCDPVGAYGYEIANAQALPRGSFSIGAMRALPIEGSPGAWGDVAKPDNLVNGYLVDVRRSGQDLLRWTGPRTPLPDAREPAQDLAARVHRECQFPAGERALAYQDFWLGGSMVAGQRRVVERAHLLGFAPKPGDTVLDVGCQSGGFLQYAHSQTGGVGRFVGVDVEPKYLDCARALARSCDQNLCFRQMDVDHERAAFLAWVRAYFPGGRPDWLLALSLEKHLDVLRLIDEVGAKVTLLETNAVAEDSGAGPVPAAPMKLYGDVKKRGGRHVGNSRDRNLRRLYRIEGGVATMG